MDAATLKKLLEQVKSGDVSVAEASKSIASLPVRDVGGFAAVDGHRALRQGFPEAVYGESKSAEQIAAIVGELLSLGHSVLVTRMSKDKLPPVQAACPAGRYDAISRTFSLRQGKRLKFAGPVGVVCAGTSDLPVAEEAALTAEVAGAVVRRFVDVGVAGLHRVLRRRDEIAACASVVVCAGMEGALPTVVAGLIPRPVVAVPTSVGYGASLGGIAALLGMLNSCAPNVAVVNIDNGFGAGYYAAMLARKG